MKGSSQPSGYTNVTNPSQVAQQPYLNFGYEQAKDQYQNTPYYPGNTVAPYYAPNPYQAQGYEALANTGQQSANTLQPAANTVFNEAATRQYGGPANPAYGGYMGLAYGDSYTPQNFGNLQSQAQWGGQNYAGQVAQYAPEMQALGRAGAQNSNLGMSQLGASASGQYLNSNPYLNAAIETAQRPTQTAYQTSIAPGLDAAAAQSGRYGSGAQAGMASTAQQNLVRGLGDISTNMSNANYARERQAQDAAAQNYGQMYNTGLGLGMTGLQNAAGLQNTAGNQFFAGQRAAQDAANQYAQAQQSGLAGLSSGFNTQNQAAMDAMRAFPGLATANQQGAQAQIAAGQGLSGLDQQYRQYQQQLIDEDMKRYNYPQQQLQSYMGLIGSPVPGSTSTPYYRNQGAEVMSGLTGALGLGKSLMGGLSKI
jgi:hypothetical protein